MRIRYKLLIITAAMILLPMTVSTVVISLVVQRQNDGEAWSRIDAALDAVADDLDLRANRLAVTLRAFLRDDEVTAALRRIARHDARPGDPAALQRLGDLLVAETRKLTRAADFDRLAFFYPDGRLLFQHAKSDNDSVFAFHLRAAPDVPLHLRKQCGPRETCSRVAWRQGGGEPWPSVSPGAFSERPRVVESGSILGLELGGVAVELPPVPGGASQVVHYIAGELLNLEFYLHLSDRTETDVALFTARHARLMPMWNVAALRGDFIDSLGVQGVRRVLRSGEDVFYAGFQPLLDGDGEVVGVVSARFSAAGTRAKTREAIFYLVGIAAVSIALMIPVALFLSHRFVRPIFSLREGALAFAAGKLEHRVPRVTNDEIGELAASFNEMAGTLQANQAELKGLNEQLARYNLDLEEKVRQATQTLVLKNQQMQHDLNLAAEFQNAILPSVPATTFLGCSLRYMPYGGGVSGDVYDISLNSEGAVNVFLGDATGHGVAAAIMTMMAQIGLDSVGGDLPTVEIIRRLNVLFAVRERDMSITAVFMRITPRGELTVTNAGHPATLVLPKSGKEVLELKEGGVPLGMFQEELVPFAEVSYTLKGGDRVFTYTDGLTEWQRADGEQFGMDRLKGALLAHRARSLEATLQAVIDDARSFAEGAPCEDDLTVLAFEYNPLRGARG